MLNRFGTGPIKAPLARGGKAEYQCEGPTDLGGKSKFLLQKHRPSIGREGPLKVPDCRLANHSESWHESCRMTQIRPRTADPKLLKRCPSSQMPRQLGPSLDNTATHSINDAFAALNADNSPPPVTLPLSNSPTLTLDPQPPPTLASTLSLTLGLPQRRPQTTHFTLQNPHAPRSTLLRQR